LLYARETQVASLQIGEVFSKSRQAPGPRKHAMPARGIQGLLQVGLDRGEGVRATGTGKAQGRRHPGVRGQREWNNRRGNGGWAAGRTTAWEQALVRLELESFSGCSGENKNRMAGKWEVKDWKNSFFF